MQGFQEQFVVMKAEIAGKDIADRLLTLSLKEGALTAKELQEKIALLKEQKRNRHSQSVPDLEASLEDTVGIGSIRRVKNLVSLTGQFKEDAQETQMLNEKAQR